MVNTARNARGAKMRLVAYDKRTGEYVDSITSNDSETLAYFRQDFSMCKILQNVQEREVLK